MTAPAAEIAGSARLGRLFAALDAAGVEWSLLRPRETLAAADGDVDLLVEPAALDRAGAVLAVERFARMPVGGREDLHAADYDRSAGRFVWVHVQTRLHVAGAAVPARELLAAATGHPVPQPADDWLLWILLLRALVDKGDLPERHRPHVQALAPRGAAPPPALARAAAAHGISPGAVVPLAAAGDWDELLRHAVARSAAGSGGAGDGTRSWRGRSAAAAGFVRRARSLRDRRGRSAVAAGLVRRARALGPSPGLSVAVIGPDGAGKTTLVDSLARRLPLPTHVQYMGLTGGRIPRADALRLPGLVLGARLAILWARYARAVWHRRRGRIVIFERYTLDGAVPAGISLGPLARASRHVQRRACPLPDLVILLDASGATMHDRSGEYDPATLERWRAAFARLRGSVEQLAVIDAERPAEAVRHDAEALVWDRWRERAAR